MESEIVTGEVKIEVQDTPVDARRMSYEDLQKASIETEEPEHTPEPDEAAKSAEPEKTIEEKQVEEKKVVETPEPEKKETQETQPETIDYAKQIEELKRSLEAKEKFIARQGTEIGMLRKQNPAIVKEQIRAVEAEYDRIYAEEGVFAAQQFLDAVKEQQRENVQRQQFAEQVEQIQNKRERITKEIPTFESEINDVAEVLKEEGFKDEFIEQFKQNPYAVSEHGELRLLRKAATYRKELSTLKSENEALKAENESLKTKPGKIIEQLNNATNGLNGKSSGTKPPENGKVDWSNLNPRRMSYEQLKQLQQGG
jgi:chromosome segregation ATPase